METTNNINNNGCGPKGTVIEEDSSLKCDICNLYDYKIRTFKHYDKKVCSNIECIKQLNIFPLIKININNKE